MVDSQCVVVFVCSVLSNYLSANSIADKANMGKTFVHNNNTCNTTLSVDYNLKCHYMSIHVYC